MGEDGVLWREVVAHSLWQTFLTSDLRSLLLSPRPKIVVASRFAIAIMVLATYEACSLITETVTVLLERARSCVSTKSRLVLARAYFARA